MSQTKITFFITLASALLLQTFITQAAWPPIRNAKLDQSNQAAEYSDNSNVRPRYGSVGDTSNFYSSYVPHQLNSQRAAASFLAQLHSNLFPSERMGKREGVIRGFLVQRSNPTVDTDTNSTQ
ncbi:uncharacterized protein LOC142358683 isoform X2 [Convolutriloba macropyga]